MSQTALYRTGGVAMIAGAVAALLLNLAHGRSPDATSTEAQLRLAADRGGWTAVHLGLAVAVLMLTGGLVAVSRSLTLSPGAGWARLGMGGALINGALFTALMATDGVAFKRVADAWAAAPDKGALFQAGYVLRELDSALLSVWTLEFLGLTVLVYGLAIGTRSPYPAWLGPAGIVLGVAGLIDGLALGLGGLTFGAFNVLFTAVSLLATAWLLVMGVHLWRRAKTLPT
jgi:hypothetical protein